MNDTVRHAVVMGGGRGIGEAIVRRFVADGYSVTIVDRLIEEANALATKLRAEGHSAFAEAVEITDDRQMAKLAETLKKRVGAAGLLAAANSVGVFNERASVLKTSLESFRRVIDINLTGAFIFSQAMEPLFAPGASLVHIGSVNGILAGEDLGAYKASKAALHMMVRCMALELARDPRRIRVNTVAPGWVDTPGERVSLQAPPGKPHPLDDPSLLAYIPLGRRTLAREIADTVSFLCSERGSGITGQAIFVDGGITTRAGQ